MSANSPRLLAVLGNQLFPLEHVAALEPDRVFMAEDLGLCTYVRHHQQKILLFLAAMRSYRDALTEAGYDVDYVELDPSDTRSYEDKLEAAVSAGDTLLHFEIEDKAMESRIVEFASGRGVERQQHASPMFLCERDRFARFAERSKRLRMAEFYKAERTRMKLLVDDDGSPAGGRWSFDEENRKKLPKNVMPPPIEPPAAARHVQDVRTIVEENFGEHPGSLDEFHWPTTRQQALDWMQRFIDERLAEFGPYEDAITTRSDTVFHSVLSPVLNLGLITPAEVVDAVVAAARREKLPLQSVEGFVRQVIGWREFVRGVYRQYSERQDDANFFEHTRELTPHWHDGGTGIPPLDDTIRTAQRLGWTHHIPRLMIVANLMTLAEIRPQSAHTWFMEMYVDSSEWVMGPNVYGMGLFSDGGIFATKPYICGSNYLRKMSDYKKGEWCDVVDGLYWRFIDRHRDFFAGNPRLALMPRALDRQSPERIDTIFAAAEEFLDRCTRESTC